MVFAANRFFCILITGIAAAAARPVIDRHNTAVSIAGPQPLAEPLIEALAECLADSRITTAAAAVIIAPVIIAPAAVLPTIIKTAAAPTPIVISKAASTITVTHSSYLLYFAGCTTSYVDGKTSVTRHPEALHAIVY